MYALLNEHKKHMA